jgi:LEA14-like dessication related protein
MSNLVKLTRVEKVGKNFNLSEVYVNPESVSYVMENVLLKRNLNESKEAWPDDVSQMHRFSTIHINGHTPINVVGDPALVEQKIFESNKQLLKG